MQILEKAEQHSIIRLQALSAMERQKAFVLAEVLVVSVIVAILAAVAIPMYLSYVKDQRKASVKGLAQTAAVSGNIYWRKTGATPDSAALKLFLPDPTRYRVSINGSWIIIRDVSTSDLIIDSARYN